MYCKQKDQTQNDYTNPRKLQVVYMNFRSFQYKTGWVKCL